MPDLAPWPTQNHPLNAADAERSKAREADIELGLTHPIDGQYWRDKLEQRIMCLEDDGDVYGLVPHEEVELQRLRALRDRAQATTESQHDAGDRRRGFQAFPPPPSSQEAARG